MKSTIILLLCCIALFGCHKESTCNCIEPYPVYYLKAVVTQTRDLSCNMPVPDFSEDAARIRSITSNDNLSYGVVNLGEEYIILQQKHYVSLTDFSAEDQFPCNTIGVQHIRLKIAAAKKRN